MPPRTATTGTGIFSHQELSVADFDETVPFVSINRFEATLEEQRKALKLSKSKEMGSTKEVLGCNDAPFY